MLPMPMNTVEPAGIAAAMRQTSLAGDAIERGAGIDRDIAGADRHIDAAMETTRA